MHCTAYLYVHSNAHPFQKILLKWKPAIDSRFGQFTSTNPLQIVIGDHWLTKWLGSIDDTQLVSWLLWAWQASIDTADK